MKKSNQKLKLMYLAKILLERTDEEHTMTVGDMIEALLSFGISAERKSIYDDLECLSLFGLDICSNKTKTTNYYIASRDFELPELKLLVDSVQSSKFITHKKSAELISKIEKLTSRENAKKLQRQVFITNRIKTPNEQIYYNVDKIYDAIAANRKILFKYFGFNTDKQKVYRKDGAVYEESPISLSWDDENYYLITYKEKYDSFTHYRVDKMEAISQSEAERAMPKQDFDLSSYSKTMFGMFGGEETNVELEFDNELVGAVIDRFGSDVPIIKRGGGKFLCRVKVAASPHFLSWVMSFGKGAKIVSPKGLAEKMKKTAEEIASLYE